MGRAVTDHFESMVSDPIATRGHGSPVEIPRSDSGQRPTVTPSGPLAVYELENLERPEPLSDEVGLASRVNGSRGPVSPVLHVVAVAISFVELGFSATLDGTYLAHVGSYVSRDDRSHRDDS